MSKYQFNLPRDDGALVPFGKYRGQSVDVMLADSSYLEWLMAQPGLVAMIQNKYPALFNIITVGAPDNDDSPEHNKLQAMFLDDVFQYAFIEAVLGKSVYAISQEAAHYCIEKNSRAKAQAISAAPKYIAERRERPRCVLVDNEMVNIDLARAEERFNELIRFSLEPTPVKPKISVEFECGYDVDFFSYWPFHLIEFEEGYTDFTNACRIIDSEVARVNRETYDSANFRTIHQIAKSLRCKIEIKPLMGDDFPSVLRQMKRNGADTLVVGVFQSSVCNLEQVRQIFGTRKILTLAELQTLKSNDAWPLTNNHQN
jgi:hypothetical protein